MDLVMNPSSNLVVPSIPTNHINELKDKHVRHKEDRIGELEKKFEKNNSFNLAKKIIEKLIEYKAIQGGTYWPNINMANEKIEKYQTYLSQNNKSQ
jgi:hypothetical protein